MFLAGVLLSWNGQVWWDPTIMRSGSVIRWGSVSPRRDHSESSHSEGRCREGRGLCGVSVARELPGCYILDRSMGSCVSKQTEPRAWAGGRIATYSDDGLSSVPNSVYPSAPPAVNITSLRRSLANRNKL